MKTLYCFLLVFVPVMLACSLTTTPPIPSKAEMKQVNNVYLATPSNIPSPNSSTIPTTCTVSAQVLHLRECAGLHCTVIGWLSEDEVLTIQEREQDWIKVTTPANQTGWVHSKYCGGMP